MCVCVQGRRILKAALVSPSIIYFLSDGTCAHRSLRQLTIYIDIIEIQLMITNKKKKTKKNIAQKKGGPLSDDVLTSGLLFVDSITHSSVKILECNPCLSRLHRHYIARSDAV